MLELFCFAAWLWLTVIGALIAVFGELLQLPGLAIEWVGGLIFDLGERFE
jgi:hypothetical protein